MIKMIFSVAVLVFFPVILFAGDVVVCLNKIDSDLSEIFSTYNNEKKYPEKDISLSVRDLADLRKKEPTRGEQNILKSELISVFGDYVDCLKERKVSIPFGSVHFVTSDGKAFTYSKKFKVPEGSYKLTVLNGTDREKRIPEGSIKLNGKKIFSSILLNRFSSKIEVEIYFDKNINTLAFELERNPSAPSFFSVFLTELGD